MGTEDNKINPAGERLGQLYDALKGCRHLLIFTHNSPDPDALAAAVGLKYLLFQTQGINSTILLNGIIGRAENREMVRRLKIHLIPSDQVKFGMYQHMALLDTQPRFGNNSFPKHIIPTIVIDHHPVRRDTRGVFVDIRPDYGATSTIISEYLFASGIKLTPNVCTALNYGIGSETEELGRETSEKDIEAYVRLFPNVALKTLAKIKHPKLGKEYFANLALALRNAFYYRNVIGSRLGEVNSPDVVSQIADLLLTYERITWSICLGYCDRKLIVSIRTTNKKAHAGDLLRRILKTRDGAGGHDMIAGGQVSLDSLDKAEIAALEHNIIERFFVHIGCRNPQLKNVLP